MGEKRTVSAEIDKAARGLLAYCRANEWAGWDPYDGLSSPIFTKVPIFRNYLCRLVFIQSMKRSPWNLRRLFRVPREQNPKGLALFATALFRFAEVGYCDVAEGHALLKRLIELRTRGEEHACWGYNFDWQTRGGFVPRFTPNIICTTFAGQALLDGVEAGGPAAYLDHAISAADYLLSKLYDQSGADETCLFYTPAGASYIHNASLLGAAFLARLYRYAANKDYKEVALAAVRYSINRQREDGAWLYGEEPTDNWIDSFHTGYNLTALECVRRSLGDQSIADSIKKGYDFMVENFFTARSTVKYFHNRELPIDMHGVATAVITLADLAGYREGSLDLAERVLNWANKNMLSPEGYYFYQMRGYGIVRIPYMRWTQAWMLRALASFVCAVAEGRRGNPGGDAGEQVPRAARRENEMVSSQ